MGRIKNRRIDGRIGYPEKRGLYDPAFEKDSCGVGFVAQIKGQASRQIMLDAYHLNSRMDHRGGCGFEENTGATTRTQGKPHHKKEEARMRNAGGTA